MLVLFVILFVILFYLFLIFFCIPVSVMSYDFTDLYHININVCVLVIIVLLCIYTPWPPSFAKHNPLFHRSEYLPITFALRPTRVMVWLNTHPKGHFWEIPRGRGWLNQKPLVWAVWIFSWMAQFFFSCTKHLISPVSNVAMYCFNSVCD